jgi:hypothetical protein
MTTAYGPWTPELIRRLVVCALEVAERFLTGQPSAHRRLREAARAGRLPELAAEVSQARGGRPSLLDHVWDLVDELEHLSGLLDRPARTETFGIGVTIAMHVVLGHLEDEVAAHGDPRRVGADRPGSLGTALSRRRPPDRADDGDA